MKTDLLNQISIKCMHILLCSFVLMGILFQNVQNIPAQAADFKHAKKIIVPPSRIPRRYDYDSMSGTIASPSTTSAYYPVSTPAPASTKSAKIVIPKNKNGLVPPPPPVAPSLLPQSMTRNIPPPPPREVQSISQPQRTRTVNRFSPHQRRFNPNLHPYGKSLKSNPQSNQIVLRAKKLMASGHLKDAQELLIRSKKTFPKDSSINNTLTEVSIERSKYYLRKDDYKDAASQARTALQYSNDDKEARSVLNQALRHQGIDSLNSTARLNQAQKLFTHGKVDEAQVEYNESLRLTPSHTAYIGLGNIAYGKGRLKTAKAHYQKALGIQPQSSVALRQLGITRYKLSDIVGANADLTRAIVQDPKDKLASQNLIDLWQRQVASRPNDANSHLGLARAYQLSGDLSSAQNEYRTVVKIDPNHPNLPAARQSFKLALARQQADKAFQAGQTLYAHEAYKEAFDKASLAVRLSPGNSKYKMFQAKLLEKLGDLNGAKQLYLSILHDDPKNFDAAKRVKALNLLVLANRPTQSNVGLLATQGSLSSSPSSLKTNQTALNVPQYRGEGPALPYLPGPNRGGTYKVPSSDPVQNMTGFLGSLRNLMLQQKKVLKANEEEIIAKINPSSSSTTSSGSPASKIGNIDTSVKPLDVGSLISSDDIKKAIAQAPQASSSSPTGSTPQSTASSDSYASTTKSTATPTASAGATTSSSSTPKTWSEIAISAGQSLAKDTRFNSLATMAATAAPNIINQQFDPEAAHKLIQSLKSTKSNSVQTTTPKTTSLAQPSVKAAPSIVKNTTSAPPLAPPILRAKLPTTSSQSTIATPNEYTNKLTSLEDKNRQLLIQLNEAQRQISSLKSGNNGSGTVNSNSEEKVSESVKGEVEHKPVASSIAPNKSNLNTDKLNLRGAIPQPVPKSTQKQVHLELLGVKAKNRNINLKVRLRNNQDKELVLPANQKAIVRMAGAEDQSAKIKFPKRKLKAHSTMEGYIKVPGKRLSPAADVFIPKLAGMSDAKENVHLTLPVPISSLNSTNH